MSSKPAPYVMVTAETALQWPAPSTTVPMAQPTPRKTTPSQSETFGRRLARIRKSRGLTQPELAEKLGISRRMMAYYEAQTEHVPAHLLAPLAAILRVPVDELLGVRSSDHHTEPPTNLRLWRKLRLVESFPPEDRKAVVNFVQALAAKRKLDHKS